MRGAGQAPVTRAQDACVKCARLVVPGSPHTCGGQVTQAQQRAQQLRGDAEQARTRSEFLNAQAQALFSQAQAEEMRAEVLERDAQMTEMQARYEALLDNLDMQGAQLGEALCRLSQVREEQPAVVPEE